LYEVLGREIIGRGRRGLYFIEINLPWPLDAKRVYLISRETSWFPGRIKLRRRGQRGLTVLKLDFGVHPYGFTTDKDIIPRPDPENNYVVDIEPFYEWRTKLRLSAIKIEPESDEDLLLHNENESAFIHKYLDYIVIRIRTSKKHTVLFIEVNGVKTEPSAVFQVGDEYGDIEYKVYEFRIKVPRDPPYICYKFHVEVGGEELEYGDEGLAKSVSPICVDLRRIEGVKEPRWFHGIVYYQIFVDSFYNGNPANDPPLKLSEDEIPRKPGYLGGDLEGIAMRVNHLEELGVEAIYLTPIFKSPSYHRYDVIDFFSVDPLLGGEEGLSKLLNELKRRGIRLILDVPIHHVSPCNSLFVDVLKNWQLSKYFSWFLFKSSSVPEDLRLKLLKYVDSECRVGDFISYAKKRGLAPFYEGFFDLWNMVKLNHDELATAEFFSMVASHWLRRGVDGFRLDVAHGIPDHWMKYFAGSVKSFREEALLLAEVMDYPGSYIELYDSVMDYYTRKVLLRLSEGRITISEALKLLSKLFTSIPVYKAVALYRTLGTHDTPRLATLVKDRDLRLLLIATMFALPGSPAIYYGDEIGLEGGGDPDNRRMMLWDTSKWDLEVLNEVKRLISLYRSYECLRRGFYRMRVLDDTVLVVERDLNDCHIAFYSNYSNTSTTIEKPERGTIIHGRLFEVLDGDIVLHQLGYVFISMPDEENK